ncbi:MAG: ABC transporter ATP-binding protein [Pseudomonadota bacterium]
MSLVLRDIRHSYGSGAVVDGASLEAGPGEIIALFGPSGCGKTTLLRVAAGLERLQEGSVDLDGATLANSQMHVPPEQRPIGFVFQEYILFPHLTVRKNIAFGLGKLAPAERETRIDAELKAVELTGFGDRYPHQLSGGQQQRAALARAFARRPRAMLLDEPFASIDVTLRQKLRAEMRRLLKARSTPTILVTHDPSEAIELGDKIAVMKNGRIIEIAPAERLFKAPKTVSAATIFPGSQWLACSPVEHGVETAFGKIAGVVRPVDAAFVVIHDGGVSAAAAKDGPVRVIDCRFSGPDWLISLSTPAAPGVVLKARGEAPIETGAAAAIAVLPGFVRIIAA